MGVVLNFGKFMIDTFLSALFIVLKDLEASQVLRLNNFIRDYDFLILQLCRTKIIVVVATT